MQVQGTTSRSGRPGWTGLPQKPVLPEACEGPFPGATGGYPFFCDHKGRGETQKTTD